MSAPEHAAARAQERLHAYSLWDRRNCQRCTKSGACNDELEHELDLFDGLIVKFWEIPLIGQVDCPIKVEKGSEQDANS